MAKSTTILARELEKAIAAHVAEGTSEFPADKAMQRVYRKGRGQPPQGSGIVPCRELLWRLRCGMEAGFPAARRHTSGSLAGSGEVRKQARKENAQPATLLIMKREVYYAHPLNIYNTAQEKRDIAMLGVARL